MLDMLYHPTMSASIVVRWALLLAFGLQLSLNGAGVITVPALLAAGGLWNLLLSVRALGGRVWRQAGLEAAGDLLLAAALFYFSRTLLGALALAGLLPTASAALGFGLAGGLAGALITTAMFAALSMIDVPLAEIPFRLALPAFSFLVAGSLLGFWRRERTRGTDGGHQAGAEKAGPAADEQARNLAVMQAASALGSTLVFDQVLDAALELCSAVANDAAPPIGGVLLFAGGGLRVAAGRGLDAKDLGRTLPGREGVLAAVLSDGQPRLAPEPAADAELGQVGGFGAARSGYVLPLRSGNDLFGALVFAHSAPDFFDEGRSELLAAAATQVAGAMQNALRYEALAEEKERLAGIEGHGQAQLARRLHDGPAQSLSAIVMRVSLARRLLPKDPAATGDELHKLEELSRLATKEMRHLAFVLRPQALEHGGLALALQDLAAQFREIYNIDVQVEADEQAAAGLVRSRQAILFSIAAEAVANACQHAQARTVVVKLARDEVDRDVLALDVRDDGTGFDAEIEEHKREANGALGLALLRERTALLGGLLDLSSQPGGTQLRVRVPLSEAAAERLRSAA